MSLTLYIAVDVNGNVIIYNIRSLLSTTRSICLHLGQNTTSETSYATNQVLPYATLDTKIPISKQCNLLGNRYINHSHTWPPSWGNSRITSKNCYTISCTIRRSSHNKNIYTQPWSPPNWAPGARVGDPTQSLHWLGTTAAAQAPGPDLTQHQPTTSWRP